MQSRVEKLAEAQQRRDVHTFCQKRAALFRGEAQRALAGGVADGEQIVDLAERMQRPVFLPCLAPLVALDQHAPPAVGSGIPDRTEYLAARGRMQWPLAERQRGLEREPRGAFEPCVVIREGRALLAFAHAPPQL